MYELPRISDLVPQGQPLSLRGVGVFGISVSLGCLLFLWLAHDAFFVKATQRQQGAFFLGIAFCFSALVYGLQRAGKQGMGLWWLWGIGSFALHGFCAWALGFSSEEAWPLWVLLWLGVAIGQGYLLRLVFSRGVAVLPLVAAWLFLWSATPEAAQGWLLVFLLALLLGMMLLFGRWRAQQDEDDQERAWLREIIAIQARWQAHKQAQIEQTLQERLLLDRHEANNLLCSIVLHANALEKELTFETPCTASTSLTSQPHLRGIEDLAAASRQLQKLFSEQTHSNTLLALSPNQQSEEIALSDVFAQLKARFAQEAPALQLTLQAPTASLSCLSPRRYGLLSILQTAILFLLQQHRRRGEDLPPHLSIQAIPTPISSLSPSPRAFLRLAISSSSSTDEQDSFLKTEEKPSFLRKEQKESSLLSSEGERGEVGCEAGLEACMWPLVMMLIELAGGRVLEAPQDNEGQRILFELPMSSPLPAASPSSGFPPFFSLASSTFARKHHT